jgi:hypothetical protein
MVVVEAARRGKLAVASQGRTGTHGEAVDNDRSQK